MRSTIDQPIAILIDHTVGRGGIHPSSSKGMCTRGCDFDNDCRTETILVLLLMMTIKMDTLYTLLRVGNSHWSRIDILPKGNNGKTVSVGYHINYILLDTVVSPPPTPIVFVVCLFSTMPTSSSSDSNTLSSVLMWTIETTFDVDIVKVSLSRWIVQSSTRSMGFQSTTCLGCMSANIKGMYASSPIRYSRWILLMLFQSATSLV